MKADSMPCAVVWPLPAEGEHDGLWCKHCGPRQPLAIDHRLVRVTVDGEPGTQPTECVECGCGALEIAARLAYAGPASVAGVQPKVSASEQAYAVCVACGKAEQVAFWAWASCAGCGKEGRAHTG